MLDAVGISDSAAQVYAELVETDQLSAAEVAERCGVSARQASAELHNLASLGLALRVTGRPVRYRAVAPDLAVSTLIAQREKELQDVRATMHRLTEVFQETARGRHPDAHVEVVHGTPNIARLAARVHGQTQRQLRGFDRPPYSEEPGASYSLENSRLAVGVAYRVIYDAAALAVPGRMHGDILPSSAAGEQARTRPELPIKLIISDDQLALIPAAVTSRSIDTTFVIHRSPILDALIALFEAEWARATPVPGMSAGPDAVTGPDAETATLLAMLAAGMTDASIARSLSWSMRTTQRRMRQLMTDLGVTTRFQAGVAARERGWL
ncbi:MAG TPA: helix-turn-helix domain-containing protein [Streptosporangiaceae bacterium]|nr:helix-turn-helix domain-containing protein [Streptosporangiaceae bacterium]